MNKLALFVAPKWCDARPDMGQNNEKYNFIETFSQCKPDYKFDTLHMDECLISYKTTIDEVLIRYCEEYRPEVIFFSLINDPRFNPQKKTYVTLKAMGIALCAFWPDTGPTWGMETIRELADFIDWHITQDYPRGPYHDSIPRVANHVNLWTPQSETLFHDRDEKTIAASFLGSVNLYRDREAYMNILKANGFYLDGGQRTASLTPYKYAELMRKSKIGINFSLSQTGVFFQAKNRIFEILASGGLMLDYENPSTSHFFKPNEDFVQFDSPTDLIEKITFYLKNDEARQTIANHGHATFQKNYNSQIFWDKVFELIQSRYDSSKK